MIIVCPICQRQGRVPSTGALPSTVRCPDCKTVIPTRGPEANSTSLGAPLDPSAIPPAATAPVAAVPPPAVTAPVAATMPPPAPAPLAPAPVAATVVVPAPHRSLLWIVGSVSALGLVLMAVVVGVMLYFAGALARREVAAADEVDQKRQAEADRDAWVNENFRSQVAERIKASAPGRDSELSDALKGYRLRAVVPEWTNASPIVRAGAYQGSPTHGSPFLADDDTLALIIPQGPVHFELWQLDLRRGDLRLAAESKAGPNRGDFHSVSWHREEGGRLLGQFIQVQTDTRTRMHGGTGRKTIYQGAAQYQWLDPLSGEINRRVVQDSAEVGPKNLMDKLMRARLPEATQAELVHGSEALSVANRRLAGLGLRFDDLGGRLSLTPQLVQGWRRDLEPLDLTHPSSPSTLVATLDTVQTAPSSPLTEHLRSTLRLSLAAAKQDADELRGFIQAVDRGLLRNLATFEMLHLIALRGDNFEDYAEFVRQDPGTPARDAAMIRLQELGYAAACRKATISILDEFMEAFPGAPQWENAFAHAYDLELESARFQIEHADDPERKREQIANAFYTRWRDSLREGRYHRAARLWKLLADESDFNVTQAAKEAQDAKDLDTYRAKTIALNKERNQILARTEAIQRLQLQALKEANALSVERNRILAEQTAQLGRIASSTEQMRSTLSSW